MLALLLATVGLFGMLAFSVQQRRQEFGIRIAVGARAFDIVGLVLYRTVVVTVCGIVFGIAAAAGLGRFLEGLLFETPAMDVPTYAAVVTVLFATALAASVAPLIRAARVDPLVALRYE